MKRLPECGTQLARYCAVLWLRWNCQRLRIIYGLGGLRVEGFWRARLLGTVQGLSVSGFGV